ncbi:hypothetical protein ACOMHN_045499 [Nucella lapillus]
MGKMEVRLKPFLFGVCACLNFGIPLTLLFSLNALFFDWLTYFKADRGLTSAVQATCIGVTLGAGLLAGVLERKLGARRSLLLGSCLSSAGLFAGSYAPSLPLLILFVGVVTGEYNKRYKKITKILTPLYVCVLVNVMVTLSAIFSFILLVLDLASDRGWTIQGGILLNFIFMLSSLIARVLVGVVSLHARVRNTALLIGGGMIGSAGLGLVGQVSLAF